MADFKDHNKIVESLQRKLLDFSKRNNLINYKFSVSRSRPNLRIIDEIPDVIYRKITKNKTLTFAGIPIPEIRINEDEKTKEFKEALNLAKQNSDTYQKSIEKLKIQPNSKVYFQIENELKDQVRELMGLPPIVRNTDFKIEEEAKKHKINPSFSLSLDSSNKTNHQDNTLQTLMFEPDLQIQLGRIYNRTKLYEQELGINTLFLVFGFLEWYESPDSNESLISPLIIMPVQMRPIKKNDTTEYEIDYFEEEPAINLSLKEKLKQDFGLELPEFNPDLDSIKPVIHSLGGKIYKISMINPINKMIILEKEIQAESFEQAVEQSQILIDSPEINDFNNTKAKSDLIKNYLLKVESLIKHQTAWQVLNQMNLSVLSFQKISLYNDLQNYQEKTPKELVLSLMDSKDDLDVGFESEYDLEDVQNLSKIPPLVSDADSSQVSAIIDVLDGKNMVIEGPPGTGKSQTITNMIAALVNQKKKVLFVAEKNAALKVVKNRLDKVGIGDYCLELHSNKARKTQVLDSLNNALKAKRNTYHWQKPLLEINKREQDIKLKIRNYLDFILSESPLKNQPNIREDIGNYLKLKGKHFNLLNDSLSFLNHQSFAKVDNLFSIESQLSSFLTTAQHLKLKNYTTHPLYKTSQIKGLNLEHTRQSVFQSLKMLEELTNQIYSFSEISFGVNSPLKDLKKVLESFGKIPVELNLNLSYFEKTFKPEVLNDLKMAVNNLEELQSLMQTFKKTKPNTQLSQILDSSFTKEIGFIIEQLQNINWHKTIGELNEEIVQVQRCLTTYEHISKDLQILINFFNYSGSLMTEDFEVLLALIKASSKITPNHLNFNSSTVHDVDQQEKIIKSYELYQKILTIKKELSEEISWDKMNLTNEQIREFSEQIKDSSWFFLITPTYFKIKSLVKNFSLVSSVKFKKVKRIIDGLNQIRKAEQEILESMNFSGLTTDKIDQIYKQTEYVYFIRSLRDHVNKRIYRKTVMGLQKLGLEQLEILHNLNDQYGDLLHFNTFLIPQKILNDELHLLYNKKNIGQKVLEYVQETKINSELNFSELVVLKSQSSGFVNSFSKTYNQQVVKDFVISKQVESVDLSMFRKIINYRDIIDSVHLNQEFKQILFQSNFISLRLNYLKTLAEQGLQSLNKLEIMLLKMPYLPISLLKSSVNNLQDLENYFQFEEDLSVLIELNNHLILQDKQLGQVPELLNTLINYDTTIIQIPEVLKLWKSYSIIKTASINYSVEDITGEELDLLRKEYQSLDEEKLKLNAQMIKSNLAALPIPKNSAKSNRVSEKVGTDLINHLLVKPNARVPLRDFLIKSGREISQIMPCFMMSPLSVAQFLPQNQLHFDVLIIDEASQVKVEDILSSVIRCDQIVVVGDNKQLPPTNFFQSEDSEDDDLDSNYESILDMTEKAFAHKRRLKWHYRSKDENLIKFSNASFYDGDLILFPATLQDRGLGLIPRRINGIYDNNKNVLEAETMVDEAIEFIKTNLDKSLGLAAINKSQAELIEDLFEERTKNDPIVQEYLHQWQDRLEPFFIKNLENVQGDERDAMFISLVYGRDLNGNFFNRFGPINSDKGHRRLNVLFSRAKSIMKVYYSIPQEEIKVDELSGKEGVRCLKNFITFLDSNGQKLPISKNTMGSIDSKTSVFEDFVFEKLSQRGLNLKRQVGESGYFIDLAVKDADGAYILGIECDGATYHSSKFMRDRDKTRQKVLESLGWRIIRIWSTDWFKDSDREINKILNIINSPKS